MNDSARRGYTVEEVPDNATQEVPQQPQPQAQPVPQQFSQAPAHNPWEQNAPEAPTVEPQPAQPPQFVQPPPSIPNSPHKSHKLRKLLFLIPAILLVATIFFVAKFSGNNYTVRQPEVIATPEPTETTPTPVPTPTPNPTKAYKSEELLIQMQIPEDYQILSEDENEVSMGRADTELFVVRTDEFANFDEEDETSETTIGGKEAVMLMIPDEGSVPVKIVQTIDEPRYEFVLFLENAELEVEFSKILESVIFLVDTSSWETFENSAYNYKIKHPPEWEATTQLTDRGEPTGRSEIVKNPEDKSINSLTILTNTNVDNAALTASEIISSTRTLSGWSSPPKFELRKLGGGDAQIIQGELTGKWRVYVVIWYKNIVIQMTWDDKVEQSEQQVFDNILSSFEFTN